MDSINSWDVYSEWCGTPDQTAEGEKSKCHPHFLGYREHWTWNKNTEERNEFGIFLPCSFFISFYYKCDFTMQINTTHVSVKQIHFNHLFSTKGLGIALEKSVDIRTLSHFMLPTHHRYKTSPMLVNKMYTFKNSPLLPHFSCSIKIKLMYFSISLTNVSIVVSDLNLNLAFIRLLFPNGLIDKMINMHNISVTS